MNIETKIPTDKFYKAVFVVGATVTLIALIVPTIDVSNQKAQIGGMLAMMYALVAWLLDNKYQAFSKYTIFSNIKLDYAQQNALYQTLILVMFSAIFYVYVIS